MTRIRIELPNSFAFSTELEVRVGDLNYGNHLGNDAVLTLIHEARRRFLVSLGLEEIGADGIGFVIADAAVVYRSQAFYAERLRIEVAVSALASRSCEFLYRMSQADGGRTVVQAKTGAVCFDFHAQKAVAFPPLMLSKLRNAIAR